MRLPGQAKSELPQSKPTAFSIKEQFKESYGKIMELKNYAEVLQVDTPQGMERAIQLDADAKNLIKAVKKRLSDIIEVPEGFVKTAKGIAKVYTELLEISRSITAKKMIDYKRFLDIERQKQQQLIEENTKALQRQLDEQAEESGVVAPMLSTPPPPPPEKTIRTSTGESVTFTKHWTFEIINPDEVDRSMCDPSPGKIRERIKGGMREGAGLRIYEEEQRSTRG